MSYFPGDVNSISYNADGNSLVSGSIDKYVKIWSVRQNQGQITSSLSGPVQSVMCVKVPSNSCFLFLLNLFGCSHLFLFPFSLFFCLFWFPLIMQFSFEQPKSQLQKERNLNRLSLRIHNLWLTFYSIFIYLFLRSSTVFAQR